MPLFVCKGVIIDSPSVIMLWLPHTKMVLSPVPFMDLFNPKTLAAFSPNLLSHSHSSGPAALTVLLTADKW